MPAWTVPLVAALLTVAAVAGVLDGTQYLTGIGSLGVGWAARTPQGPGGQP